jgi:hypothetical protein
LLAWQAQAFGAHPQVQVSPQLHVLVLQPQVVVF